MESRASLNRETRFANCRKESRPWKGESDTNPVISDGGFRKKEGKKDGQKVNGKTTDVSPKGAPFTVRDGESNTTVQSPSKVRSRGFCDSSAPVASLPHGPRLNWRC